MKKSINPTTLFDSRQFGFSQIVTSPPGTMIFISGQVAWDENGNIVGENNFKKQTQKVFENLEIAMQSAGGSLDNIVMLRIYVVNFKEEYSAIVSESLLQYFNNDNPPASTWISVSGLANDKFMLEVEAQAIF